MYKIEIGAGFMVTALAGFGLLQSTPANIILVIIGVFLMFHGSYEIYFKPHVFLRKRLTKWLLARNWKVSIDKEANFYLVIWAEDSSNRKVMISRDKKDKGILAFTALVHEDNKLLSEVDKLSPKQKRQLIEDITAFLAGKDMGYEETIWPMNKLAVQHALPLDSQLSEHIVDLKAKEVINAVIGVRSLTRKAITLLEPDKEGSQNQ